jgi:hypothetical protein
MIREKLKKSLMQENNFEKKVQQRMEELNISPSGAVWDKVYARIKKEKRRRFILWFLFAGILLLGGGAFWLSEKKDTGMISDHTADKKNTTDKETKEGNAVMLNKIDNREKETHEKLKQPENKAQPAIEKGVVTEKKGALIKEFKLPQKFKKNYTAGGQDQPAKKSKYKPASIEPVESPKANQQSDLKNADAGKILPSDLTEQKTGEIKNNTDKPLQKPDLDSLQHGNIQQPSVLNKDSVIRRTTVNDSSVKQKAENPKDPAIAAIKKEPSSKKWSWGVHFTPGISSMNEQLLSLGNTKSADFSSSPNSTGGGAAAPRAGPSVSKPGLAFQVGVFVQRNLSRRTKFETGLQYAYYSDRITVGRRNGSVNQSLLDYSVIHSAGDSIKFTNRYHFLELPAGVKIQMNKKPVKPLYLNMGFNIGWMAGTNALVYDTASGGIYYNSKKHFNRLQFSLSLGLDWTLFKNDKIEWHIGPVINLHFDQMLNNPLDRNKYLFFAGIRTSILFNKKK